MDLPSDTNFDILNYSFIDDTALVGNCQVINPVSISTAVISPIELLNTTISSMIINEYFGVIL